jgi:hypothetical protein
LALATPADWVLMATGVAVIAFGIRGMPGTRRLLARPGIRHTWRHGALVFAALTYAIIVPAVGALIVLWALLGVAD